MTIKKLNLKLLIITILIACDFCQGVILTKEARAKLVLLAQKCAESSGTNAAQMLIPHRRPNGYTPEERQFIGCLLRSLGVINESGKVQVDRLKSILPKSVDIDRLVTVADGCKVENEEATADEKAFLVFQCVKNKGFI